MSKIWDARIYDSERRRLVPCFDDFYGSVARLIARLFPNSPCILDLGAGTGILSGAIAGRVPACQFTLLDASSNMLQRAATRLERWRPQLVVRQLTDALPEGPFDAVVSALAIHHLSDDEKRDLFARILRVLKPGGVFLNAEQVIGGSARLQEIFEAEHLDSARALGSSEVEITGAVERMKYDRCATVGDQLAWLAQEGYSDVECFYRSFRFAVFGGWR